MVMSHFEGAIARLTELRRRLAQSERGHWAGHQSTDGTKRALSFVRYSHQYDADERAAQDGLSSGAFIAPWDWRSRSSGTMIHGGRIYHQKVDRWYRKVNKDGKARDASARFKLKPQDAGHLSFSNPIVTCSDKHNSGSRMQKKIPDPNNKPSNSSNSDRKAVQLPRAQPSPKSRLSTAAFLR
jgi:hypothetical protein